MNSFGRQSYLALSVGLIFGTTPTTTIAQSDIPNIDNEQIEIIEVNALRRAASIQTVPVAVSAFRADLLDNIGMRDIRDLENLSPSIDVSTGQSAATATSISIRGIGTGSDNPGFEPAVGIFIDGVYRSRTGVALSELPELERVEVLRGPQGTLFGKNTSAGALTITTKAPSFDQGGYISGAIGNFSARELKGAYNTPANDEWAFRINGSIRERDGYIEDVNSTREFNDIDRYSLRGQALYEGAELTARFIMDSASTNENCCASINIFTGPTASAVEAGAGLLGLTGIVSGDSSDPKVSYSPNRDLGEKVDEWGFSADIQWDLDIGTLYSLSAYRDWDVDRGMDVDFSGIDRAYRDDYLSGVTDFMQEVRLQGLSMDDKLDWLVGFFYSNQELSLQDTVRVGTQGDLYVDLLLSGLAGGQLFGSLGPQVPALLPFLLPGSQEGDGQLADKFDVETKSVALFTHNVYELTDDISVTLGLRYLHETKDIGADLKGRLPVCDFYLDPANTAITQGLIAATGGAAVLLSCNPAINTEFNGVYSDDRSENAITGTLKVAYQISSDIMVYGGYDRGYKAGGYNLDRGGFDSALFGGDGAQLTDLEFSEETVNAFELGIKSKFINNRLLVNTTLFLQNFRDYQSLVFSGTNFTVQNVDKTISQGLEFEANYSASEDLQVGFAYTYNEARFDDSANLEGTPLDGLQGKQLAGSPRNAYNVNLTYTPHLTDTTKLVLHTNIRTYSSHLVESSDLSPRNDGVAVVGAKIGITDIDDRWSVALRAENLFEEDYLVAGFFVPEQNGTFAAYPSPPRFITLEANYKF
ncbi:TonB-dependent receptor [Alteromonas oceanisediminis]|uniref:TonB-dependent receptor n=1 Tax=Alteromonas oceanisediminis TaxID=2836180 RepID=UPI001BDB030E|nr:TonB-dependent receptor [Alteromonas oceanisediminis]MBT0586302.1 TonB-dependent receptor [Alteromonas oceanisediminis]